MFFEMDGMPMGIQTEPESQDLPPGAPRHRLWWLRLLAGPIIYGAYFAVAYLAVEAACRTGWLRFTVADTNGITVTVLVLTVAAAAAVFISLLTSHCAGGSCARKGGARRWTPIALLRRWA